MTRFTHLILLLLSLMVIVRIGLSGPWSPEDKPVKVSQEKVETEVVGKKVFNPEVSSPLPDLNEGYLFVEGRLLEESDFDEFNKTDKNDSESVDVFDLEEVTYAGSVIIGDLRKALITFPAEPTKVAKGARRAPAKGRAAVVMYEQLAQGGVFKGFLVQSVEEDRIVFEKNGERVEKFLHDQNKERIVVKSQVREPASPPAQAPVVVSAPPDTSSALPEDPVPVAPKITEPKPTVERAAPSKPKGPPPGLPQRRSQRLLKLDPSFMVPPPAGMVAHQPPPGE